MKRRSFLLVALMIVLSVTTLIVFAQGEPMANPDCTADAFDDTLSQIDQIYTDGQTALEDGDVRTWLDSLREISWLSGSLRAFCDNYVFEGDAEGSDSQVFGPMIFMPGIYTVMVTTDGFIGVEVTEIDGDCDFYMGASEGDAVEGTQEVFVVEDNACTGLLEIGNLTEDWRVEFSLVSAGD